MLRKPQEYEYLKQRVPKEIISQIKSIAELQNLSFDDAFKECIQVGINFRNNNYALQSREMKIRTLDNMLSQIYPFLNKTYEKSGLNITIFDKVVCLVVDLRHVLYKKKAQQLEELGEVIKSDAFSAINYVYNNFPEEYKEIKDYLFNIRQNKPTRSLFNTISTKSLVSTNTMKLRDTHQEIATVTDYDSSEQHEQTDKDYVSSKKLRK